MNNSNGKRKLDWQGIFRGVQNKDVLPAAPKEGFTAARKMHGNQVSAPEEASSS